MFKRIILNTEELPEPDLNKEIQWLSNSLGLFNDRDKEKSCYRLFVELVKAKKEHKRLNSQELSLNSNLSRSTVIHHVEKLIDSGIVIEKHHRFELKQQDINSLILGLKQEINELFEEMEKISKKIDEELF